MNELVHLVEGERREQAAIAVSALFGLGVVGALIAAFWTAAGVTLAALGVVGAVRALNRRRQFGRLLDERAEIERVERVTWLGRPALRVTFVRKDEITLPTWNADRERVFELLQRRELPPARVVR